MARIVETCRHAFSLAREMCNILVRCSLFTYLGVWILYSLVDTCKIVPFHISSVEILDPFLNFSFQLAIKVLTKEESVVRRICSGYFEGPF